MINKKSERCDSAPFFLFVLLMPISPLLTVFGFLSCRAGPVSPSNVFLLLRFGFHLATLLPRSASASERNPILQNTLKVVFFTHIKHPPHSPEGDVEDVGVSFFTMNYEL